jgi:hypothetical protein
MDREVHKMSKEDKICSVPSPTLRIASQSLSLSGAYNNEYEATAFGFRPNPRFTRTSHIRRTFYDISCKGRAVLALVKNGMRYFFSVVRSCEAMIIYILRSDSSI